jgi:hypothetical protein
MRPISFAVLSFVISSFASSISLSVKLGLAPTNAKFCFGSFLKSENPVFSFFLDGDFLCEFLLFYLF